MHVCTFMLYKHIMKHTHTHTHKERCTERERLRERSREREVDKANLEKPNTWSGTEGAKVELKKKDDDAAAKSHVSYTNLMLFLYTKKKTNPVHFLTNAAFKDTVK